MGCKREPTATRPEAAASSSGDHHRHHAPMPDSSAPPLVSLQVGGTKAQVDLRTLPAETVAGKQVVRLSQVWRAAGAGSAVPGHLDFVGDDGFRPGTKPRCPDRLAGSMLDHGFLDQASRNLTWDDDRLPGCYRVRGVATIEAVDP